MRIVIETSVKSLLILGLAYGLDCFSIYLRFAAIRYFSSTPLILLEIFTPIFFVLLLLILQSTKWKVDTKKTTAAIYFAFGVLASISWYLYRWTPEFMSDFAVFLYPTNLLSTAAAIMIAWGAIAFFKPVSNPCETEVVK